MSAHVHDPDVRRHESPQRLAQAVAQDLVAEVERLQAGGAVPAIVLTGGTIARHVHRAVASASRTRPVDWSRVDVFWGDERYVPAESEDRNDLQARQDLLGAVPVDPARVHPMPVAIGGSEDLAAAASAYDALLAAHAEARGDRPAFDIVMLGVGEDGHCASLFPGFDLETDTWASAVRDSPKPPPERITMTLRALRSSAQVWFIASGESKAGAVAGSVDRKPPTLPVAVVRGEQTRWYVDREAASALVG